MFKKVSDWFRAQLEAPQEVPDQHTVELATAVLLYEIMRADDKFEEAERQTLKQALEQHFSLSEQAITELTEMSTQHAHKAADFVQFTRIINAQCDMLQKRAILESLWRVAYADGTLDAHEEHLIRRIADLLYVPHSQFIQSKLSVNERS